MAEIKISENLSQKLDKGTGEKIKFLTDFEASIKEKLSEDKCPDAVRGIISNKMKKITEVVLKIHTINKSHRSNDEKKEKIQAVLAGVDIKEFLNMLNTEIEGTKEFLLTRAKGMGREIGQDAKDFVDSVEKLIKSNQELVIEEKDKLKKEESELKKGKSAVKRRRYNPENARQTSEAVDIGEFGGNDEDRSAQLPAKVEPLGFWKTFKKLLSERKDNPDKKVGVFASLKTAWNASFGANGITYEDGTKMPLDKDLQSGGIDADKLYDMQLQLEKKIKKCEEDYKKLEEQLKEVKKELKRIGEEGLKDIKSSFDEAVKPVVEEEITEEKITGVAERIAVFSRDNKVVDWFRNIKGKVLDKVDDIEARILEEMAISSYEKSKDKLTEIDETEIRVGETEKARDERKDDFIQSRQADENARNSAYLDNKVAKKVIKGINAAEYIIANTRYKLQQGKLEKKKKEYEHSSSKVDKYIDKSKEIKERKESRNSGIDR